MGGDVSWAERRRSIRHFFVRHPICVSLYEAVFVFAVSNAALIFLVFARVVDNKGASFSFTYAKQVIASAMSSTEIFVYVLALIAPALYVMVFVWQAKRHVLFFFVLAGLQLAIIVGSAYIYGRAKSGGVENLAFASSWAWTCYLLGLLIWYISLVYDKVMKSTEIRIQPPSGQTILRNLG